jgi:hypothetical protein
VAGYKVAGYKVDGGWHKLLPIYPTLTSSVLSPTVEQGNTSRAPAEGFVVQKKNICSGHMEFEYIHIHTDSKAAE